MSRKLYILEKSWWFSSDDHDLAYAGIAESRELAERLAVALIPSIFPTQYWGGRVWENLDIFEVDLDDPSHRVDVWSATLNDKKRTVRYVSFAGVETIVKLRKD